MQILILTKTDVPLKRCDHTGVMLPMHYPKFSMSTLQILVPVLKSDVLKNLFILCKHGTKVNNGSSLFLLTDVYLVTIVFSEQGWLQMASV
jgi:hypothetical protein